MCGIVGYLSLWKERWRLWNFRHDFFSLPYSSSLPTIHFVCFILILSRGYVRTELLFEACGATDVLRIKMLWVYLTLISSYPVIAISALFPWTVGVVPECHRRGYSVRGEAALWQWEMCHLDSRLRIMLLGIPTLRYGNYSEANTVL